MDIVQHLEKLRGPLDGEHRKYFEELWEFMRQEGENDYEELAAGYEALHEAFRKYRMDLE